MRQIAIDIRSALSPHPTGKGQWVRGFVMELMKREFPVILVGDRPLTKEWLPYASTYQRFSSGLLWHFSVAWWLRKSSKEMIWIAPTSFIVPFLVGSSVAVIPVIHDLIAFDDEPHDRKARVIERWTLGRTLAHARHICTISDATKLELIQRFSTVASETITNISVGPFRSTAMQNHPDGKTILCVATLCPRKNQLRLIEAFKLLPEKLRSTSRLILAGGRGWFDQPIVDAAASTENVQWLDYVSDEEYERLLSTCTVFAYPSLKEGFGIPALDALQRGVPVLTSDRSSLPEVAGSAALYVDPESVESIAQCLEILLTNDMMRGMLAEAGPVQATKFSWKRTVDLFLEVLRNLPDNDN